uniref:Uncharacterized protein n=1 Tax=Siphoviridae sp. ctFKD2 TaxID=2825403 RepID=A0A8S5NY41_9CAUD|nr:MAG TPA: hypothetical protein [Siphoviridae sp. ctFKD2]
MVKDITSFGIVKNFTRLLRVVEVVRNPLLHR